MHLALGGCSIHVAAILFYTNSLSVGLILDTGIHA